AFDWSRTPVGAIAEWPEVVLTTVNMILASRNPMLLMWGDDLIQFYNDAFRPSIRDDKHPSALGQAGRDCWPEAWEIIGPQIEGVMIRGEATWHENQLVPIHRNGRSEDVYWTYGYSPVRDGCGKICAMLVVCTETTEVVLARWQLEQERERLNALFQQAPAFFAVMNGPEHRFEMINPLYQELIGDRDVIGKTVREAVPEAEGQGFVELLDRVYRTGAPYVGRRTPIHLARSANEPLELRYLDFVYQPRRDAVGAVVGIIVLGVDATEQKRAEQVLVQSEKLNAVGRLASSIAHEINNPLEAVTNLLYLAQLTEVNPDTKLYLASAEVELRRVAAIANQTLRFYRQSTKARAVSPDELIDGTLPLYQGRIANHNITVERRDRACRAVTCFDGEIRQVLSNLVGNAIDAMSGRGGRLLLRARDGRDTKTGRRGVVLTVADTGTGMSAHTRARLYEPFFTTKGESGTGLGLWISHEIIERHNGVLRVRTKQGPGASGTVFTLFVPYETEGSAH
ncbi:MAG TPA: ATP-binding protein, partial [Acidobacteriaceae bacterium]|nr:ATP-binding protein [Acidobacteriaceae bacterium]